MLTFQPSPVNGSVLRVWVDFNRFYEFASVSISPVESMGYSNPNPYAEGSLKSNQLR